MSAALVARDAAPRVCPRSGLALDERMSQWHTDPRLARAFVRWAGVRAGEQVLDAGAGSGVITDAIISAGGCATAVEFDPRFAAYLRARFGGGVRVLERDFLDHGERAQRVIGNPPFEADNEGAWMLHGAELAPRVAMIMRLHGVSGRGRWDRHWSWLRVHRVAPCVPRPPFFGSGMHEIAVVEASLRRTRRRAQETDRIAFGPLRWS